jgi:hypothetical protein
MLGILMLDTAFPRIPGDVGHPATFTFAVRHAIVAGATPDRVVRGDRSLLAPFVAAGRQLVEEGCAGIATTCGFLVRHQAELADALRVPVMTSVLLALPLVARTLARDARVGVVTYSTEDLDAATLALAGADPATPVCGLDPQGYLACTIRCGAATFDADRARDDTVNAARKLVGERADVTAIVLECANLPPYAHAVRAATGLPVFDAAALVGWFHAALPPAGRKDARTKRRD